MQVITSLDADSFGSWEEAGFAPEEAFLEKVAPARIRTLFPLQESSLHRQWKILGNDCSSSPLTMHALSHRSRPSTASPSSRRKPSPSCPA